MDFQTKKIHFELAFVIGDMSGHDSLCGHYKGYSKSIQRPCRACKVNFVELDDPFIECQNVIAAEIYAIVKETIDIRTKGKHGTLINADDKCKAISQKQILPIFSRFRFGGCPGGIFECTPPETIHALLLGIIQNIFECIFNYKVNEVVELSDNEESKPNDGRKYHNDSNHNEYNSPKEKCKKRRKEIKRL